MVKDILELKPIDAEDTISVLIKKLNDNFATITETGIFNIEEDIPEDNHDYLCDALLIKPHQPIHRRKKILEPFDNRKDISWLSNVDYLLGDVAIVEQKRVDDKTCNQVYMYTIGKDDNTGETILEYETELTGPTGKDAEVYLTYDSQTIFENTRFNQLNINRLVVSSIDFTSNSSLSATEIITSKLKIGNLTFNGGGERSELGTNILNVDTIYGFRGAIDTITFGSPIIVDKISASSPDEHVSFETAIKTDRIDSYTDELPITLGSSIKSSSDTLNILSSVCLDELKSISDKIYISSPIGVNEISSKDSDNVKFNSPIAVDKITASNTNSISIDSHITCSDILTFDTSVDFMNEFNVDCDNVDFKQYHYNDKHHTPGMIFLGFDNMTNIEIPELLIPSNEEVDFARFEKPYSYVPFSGVYYIAEITTDTNTWYGLIQKSERKFKEDKVRVFTTRTDVVGQELNNEDVYELISTNNIYKDIFTYLNNNINPTKTHVTIGFTTQSSFSTYIDCTIKIKQIPYFSNQFGIGENTVIYYLMLY